ncbi:hypothetical protein CC85DRAFT_325993 [Cutaneotrichosporon oleaginosum]|uniref:HAM1-like N-terminal domain-containing protein n=1 Tax=Cutaneotrichosporon oleaginosum TaxID=879819 RepID=A0A0J0XVI3_9TREE|nr:uncharacterized protein CC85DRAFT_325993 [Cutaneotrichosporon oleaginosum]KLT45082.1 hypothetical protein CC85DRAFT_325993 [Cutaneotrichosporon oleaginosum]
MKLHRDVSEHPTSGGLTELVDAQQDADIEKDTAADLQLITVLSALRNGYLPSNVQLYGWLDRVSSLSADDALSGETAAALAALKNLGDTLRRVLAEKNGDELLQDTVWMAWYETRSGSERAHLRATLPVAPPAGEGVTGGEHDRSFEDALARDVDAAARKAGDRDGELREAVGHIRTLGTILFTNPQLRAAISEITALAREYRRGEESRTEEGSGPPGVGVEPDTVQDGAAVAIGESATIESEDRDWRDLDDFHIPGEFGDPESGWGADGEVFFDAETTVTLDPRVTAFLYQLRDAIARMQEQEGYPAAMAWLLDTFAAYEYEVICRTHPELAPDYPYQPRMTPTRRILANLVTLAERFAAHRSLGPVQQSINKLYAYVLEDVVSRALSIEIDGFIRQVFLEKGYVSTDACVVRAAQLWDRLSAWLSNEVHAAQWNAAWAGMAHFLGIEAIAISRPKLASWFSDDPLTQELETRWTAVTDALLLDNRRLALKRSLWSELGRLAASAINWRGFVTLPRIELVTPGIELILENVHLSLANLFPSILDVQVYDRTRFSPFADLRASCAAANKTRLRVRGEQIQADMRDALISLRFAKLGFSDQGRADIALTRRGITFDIELEFDTHPDAKHIITATRIDFGIDELSLTAKGTRRDGLYAALLPSLGVPFLKWRMASKWKQKLARGIRYLNTELCELRDRLNVEKGRAGSRDMRASTRLLKVTAERLQEFRSVVAERKGRRKRAIRAYRRERGYGSSSNASDTSSSDESSDDEVGPGEPDVLRGFRISFALADAILPHITADPERSLLYRRERAEKAARRAHLDNGRSHTFQLHGMTTWSPVAHVQ